MGFANATIAGRRLPGAPHSVLVWQRLPTQRIGPMGAPHRVLVWQRLLVLRIVSPNAGCLRRLPHRRAVFQIEVLHPVAASLAGSFAASLLGRCRSGFRLGALGLRALRLGLRAAALQRQFVLAEARGQDAVQAS